MVPDWMEPVDARAEAEEFERGSEDMELRAMRLEAEREARVDGECAEWEAYQDYLDATAERGSVEPVLSFEEFMKPRPVAPVAATADPFGEDDIPF